MIKIVLDAKMQLVLVPKERKRKLKELELKTNGWSAKPSQGLIVQSKQSKTPIDQSMRISKFSLFIIVAFFVTACQSLNTSKDVTVLSDLNEKSVVKEQTVKKKVFDKDEALNEAKEIASKWQEVFTKDKCSKEKYNSVRESCLDTYKENTVPAEKLVKDIENMPELITVRYRRLFTDVNGDRSATDYERVACIPGGTKEEIKAWVGIVTKDSSSLRTNRSTQEQDMKSHPQLVADAVCSKYGGLNELDKKSASNLATLNQ